MLSLSRQALCTYRTYATKFIQSCPKPTYDTGCTHCQIPEFPQDKQINFEHSLNGTSPIPWKHVLVLLHGVGDFADMASKINLIPGSMAQDFEILKRNHLSALHPVTLSNALISGEPQDATKRHRVRIYPDNVEVDFLPHHVQQFMEHYLLPEEAPQEVYNPFVKDQSTSKTRKLHPGLFKETSPQKDLVLICGHAKRDIRCGVLAPLLEQEFLKVLEREGIAGNVDVGLISHIGGHAYAGNVIFFPANPSRMPVTWYERVFPENVQGIVQATIKEGKIIKDLYRGQPSDL
ncbi:altered inheritance of mitochondria protein 32 [Metschnikowia bicuspidata var. bicuspidata NRRL YB-4993]|uniref:Altered inheritance of mitochondria protein 32 n=1 Tax=Metschnikowia bicuspidata var. bicuspidata NRRL YB-4993 TaxID=869754 RepID=A0A1A0HFQ5_9ASCO|nr:altered inheritance of mitochondria protein 32 [Metschnikowia bicuspidata var. bicuspidata NRRL YB-4993]OBA22688.1 altered inheritance of mitochondria protein 32 [Metschnikowia bicuspidata var. bicuspidata NRRL YB-4993]